MSGQTHGDTAAIVARLRRQSATDAIRISLHAHQEMVEEDIALAQIQEVLADARVLENYPNHKRGPCCLLCGQTAAGRYIHVVCTTSLEVAIIITAYEPKPPKWRSPSERGPRS